MRKTYAKEFKLEICHSVSKGETRISDISKQYTISRPIISRWLAEYKRYGEDAFMGKGIRLPDEAKIYTLEKEIERLKEENIILKKFEEFAKNPKR